MPRIPDSRTRVTAGNKRRRGNAGLIATICVIVLLVVVTGILATRALDKPHGSNATGNHSSSSTTPNVPEVGMDSTPKLDYAHMRVALSNYYALLPGDPNDAFNLLSTGYQRKTGFANFVKFYAGISQVTVRDILPLGPGNVSGVVTFVKEGGGTTHELYHFTFTVDHDKLLMSNAVRVGGQ
jgi:hypothetical protein